MYGTATISGIEKYSTFRLMREKWNEYKSHPTNKNKGGKSTKQGNNIKA